jgi:hypothetical protein
MQTKTISQTIKLTHLTQALSLVKVNANFKRINTLHKFNNWKVDIEYST